MKKLPQQQIKPVSEQTERILLLCFYDTQKPSIMGEKLSFIQKNSYFPLTILNLFEHSVSLVSLNLTFFHGIIFHPTVLHLKEELKIEDFSGIQLIIKEDVELENLNTQVVYLLEQNKCLNKPIFISEKPSKNVLLLAAHEPVKDPRLSWIVNYAPLDTIIIQLGVNLLTKEAILVYPSNWKKENYLKKCSMILDDTLLIQASKNETGRAAVFEIREIQRLLSLTDEKLSEQYGAPLGSYRLRDFRWYLRYILNITAVLLEQAVNIRGIQAIIATDLPTLSTALILKALFNIQVLYDAHEYWPEADIECYEFEIEFWRNMEGRLLAHTNYCQTVSPPLAELMSATYHISFKTLPNCIPLASQTCNEIMGSHKNGQCRFLFQGNFAVGRGIDVLIDAWSDTDPKSILLLRGPDTSYKDEMIKLAKKSGLLGTRILFLPAVDESDLVKALSDGDVGLIPYEPILANYTNCCPNKMSQYFAAGIPILANDTKFIKEIIETSQSGIVVDFRLRSALLESINKLVIDFHMRKKMGENGHKFHQEKFHWEIVSGLFYQAINNAIAASDGQKKYLKIFAEVKVMGMYDAIKKSKLLLAIQSITRVFLLITPLFAINVIKKNIPIAWKRKMRFFLDET